MAPADRRFAEALLRAIRGMRHAAHAAELAVAEWMREHGAAPERADASTGEPKER